MSDPELVFQLRAMGVIRLFDSSSSFRSSTVYESKEAAERRIPEFRKIVTNVERLFALEGDDSLKIDVVPLEIIRD